MRRLWENRFLRGLAVVALVSAAIVALSLESAVLTAGALMSVAFFSVIWLYKRHYARRALREAGRGTRCLSCNSPKMAPDPGGMRCQMCGHLSTHEMLQALGGAHVDATEMDAMARPEELRR